MQCYTAFRSIRRGWRAEFSMNPTVFGAPYFCCIIKRSDLYLIKNIYDSKTAKRGVKVVIKHRIKIIIDIERIADYQYLPARYC